MFWVQNLTTLNVGKLKTLEGSNVQGAKPYNITTFKHYNP